MDWSNERYVRLYTRDTTTWKVLDWRARFVLMSLLRKVDRSGVVDVGDEGIEGLAAVLEIPLDILEPGLAQLTKRKTVEQTDHAFVIPNFLEAQEARQSDAQRQRASRERRRDQIRAGLQPSQKREVVYFIQAAGGGPIKIGYSDDVAARLAQLQTSHPDTLVLLATQPGTPDIEAELHRQFSALRRRGEWFDAGEELLAHIRVIACDSSRSVTTAEPVTDRDGSRAVTPSDPTAPAEQNHQQAPAPRAPAIPQQATSWQRRKAWWDYMNAAHDRLRKPTDKRAAIKAGTPDLSKFPNEQAMLACEQFLRAQGYDDAGIDAKMRHVVDVNELQAEQLGHLDFFKPALIWDTTNPNRFPRKVDTSLEEAAKPPASRVPAQPSRAPRGAIGASTPHHDHGSDSKPAREVM